MKLALSQAQIEVFPAGVWRFTKAPFSRCHTLLYISITYYLLLTSIFFYLGFFSRTLTKNRAVGEWGGTFCNSSLPFPSTSQTLTHEVGDYCREITAHS